MGVGVDRLDGRAASFIDAIRLVVEVVCDVAQGERIAQVGGGSQQNVGGWSEWVREWNMGLPSPSISSDGR